MEVEVLVRCPKCKQVFTTFSHDETAEDIVTRIQMKLRLVFRIRHTCQPTAATRAWWKGFWRE